jgi:putative oxidoreductase
MSELPAPPPHPEPWTTSAGLLALRVGGGLLMMSHGWSKLSRFDELSADFSDPLGVGASTSLVLAIFAELVCAALLVPGLLTRLAAVPYAFTMVIAHFVVHSGDAWSRKELSAVYLLLGLVILVAGPGRYSADAWLAPRIAAWRARRA